MTSFRAERTDDIGAVRAVVASAFGQAQGVHLLLDDLRASVAWLELSFVATEHDAVVGHVAFSRAWVDDPRRVVDVLVLSPVSVSPSHQRRGIGSALVRFAVEQLRHRPEPLVFLEGDPAFYSRLGFVPAEPLGFTAPSVRIPAPGFQVQPLPSYDGEVRGALVYPDVFWRHDAVGLRG